jgi:hypothetical protein
LSWRAQQSNETSDPVHGVEGFDQLSDCQLQNEIKDKRTIYPKKRLGLKTSITSTGYKQTLEHGWFKHIFHSVLTLQSEKVTIGTAPSELYDIIIQHSYPQPSNRDTELLPSLLPRFVLSIYGNNQSSFSILSDDRSKASSKTIPPHSTI